MNTNPVDYTFKKTHLDRHEVKVSTFVKNKMVSNVLKIAMTKLGTQETKEIEDDKYLMIPKEYHKNVGLAFRKTLNYINKEVKKQNIIVVSDYKLTYATFRKNGNEWVLDATFVGYHEDKRGK